MSHLATLLQAPLPEHIDQRLDESGLLCPLPLVHLSAALRHAKPGHILHIIATDPGFIADLLRWLRVRPHRLLALRQESDKQQAWLVCADADKQ